MILDEAIEHAREVAEKCGPCAEEHQQLVEWLEELKVRREKDAHVAQLEDGNGLKIRTV